jgi:hypothetical protein
VTVPVYAAAYFTLANCANYGAFTNLFDQYMIEEIEVWIEPNNVVNDSSQGAVASAIDLDDVTVPSTFANVAQKQGALISGLSGHYHRFIPHIAIASYAGAFTSYTNCEPMWIDGASPNVQHYGLKTAAVAGSTAVSWTLTSRFLVAFRAPGVGA